jgi:hypothetical protein
MKECQTRVARSRAYYRTLKVFRPEANVAMNGALAGQGKHEFADQRGLPFGAFARMPESKTQILLPVGANQMLHAQFVHSAGNGGAIPHCVSHNRSMKLI